jgi:hypothetical protein
VSVSELCPSSLHPTVPFFHIELYAVMNPTVKLLESPEQFIPLEIEKAYESISGRMASLTFAER